MFKDFRGFFKGSLMLARGFTKDSLRIPHGNFKQSSSISHEGFQKQSLQEPSKVLRGSCKNPLRSVLMPSGVLKEIQEHRRIPKKTLRTPTLDDPSMRLVCQVSLGRLIFGFVLWLVGPLHRGVVVGGPLGAGPTSFRACTNSH